MDVPKSSMRLYDKSEGIITVIMNNKQNMLIVLCTFYKLEVEIDQRNGSKSLYQ